MSVFQWIASKFGFQQVRYLVLTLVCHWQCWMHLTLLLCVWGFCTPEGMCSINVWICRAWVVTRLSEIPLCLVRCSHSLINYKLKHTGKKLKGSYLILQKNTVLLLLGNKCCLPIINSSNSFLSFQEAPWEDFIRSCKSVWRSDTMWASGSYY